MLPRARRHSFVLHAALLLAALATYLFSPDDVVWRLIKSSPRARLLEHAAFAGAALLLGVALLLEVQASIQAQQRGDSVASRSRTIVAALLQAIGIGSLLPLPGFLLLVLGESLLSVLLPRERLLPRPLSTRSREPSRTQARGAVLLSHLGLCCAFVSMVIFSIVLVDRVADALFAVTGVVALMAASRAA